MKSTSNLALIVLIGMVTLSAPLVSPGAQWQARPRTTWEDVADYIAAHATERDAITEAMLQAEAEAGVKTWVTFAGTGGGGSFQRSILNGPGLGWPSASHVIRFATTAETNTAAGLIDDVTSGVRSRRAASDTARED